MFAAVILATAIGNATLASLPGPSDTDFSLCYMETFKEFALETMVDSGVEREKAEKAMGLAEATGSFDETRRNALKMEVAIRSLIVSDVPKSTILRVLRSKLDLGDPISKNNYDAVKACWDEVY